MLLLRLRRYHEAATETLDAWRGARIAQRRVAATYITRSVSSFPVHHGMLEARGETIEPPLARDFCDVFVDKAGDLVALLMNVQSNAESQDGFGASLMRETRSALLNHRPLHGLVNALELELAARPSLEAGLVILRLSQRNANVEILNAGMPAVLTAGPSERVSLHPALSGPLGRHVGEVHPYELVPLVRGSTWLTISDGMMKGLLDPIDGTFVLISVDPKAGSQSGID